MKRDCPTIQELLAFDAVARHDSITLAAGALCITVSAVSKQIAGLETFLGRKLIQKNGRGVQLTPQGRVYWQKIASGLRAIETATFEARSGHAGAGVLTLASVPTFLTQWLIPRLPAFRQESRQVTLSFSRHLEPTDGIPPGVDAAIRYGAGSWPGVVSEYIAGREFVLIAARALVRDRHRIVEPSDLLGHTLLHHEGAPTAWRHWAGRHGVPEAQAVAGPRFAQYSALIQAALNGLGIGLVPRLLVEDELREGSLLSPCGAPVSIDQGHYLCYRPDRLEPPAFAAFRAWLLTEGRRAGGGPAQQRAGTGSGLAPTAPA
ncbi:LysR substrate-binding domain-containing protein [Xylophilus ampelinus]|uniref:LysR family transcriptional regulator n=1 Tax=Xylophilus ampelinus TaxID=54067 RepID=A0A318SLG5_9BURK|nr:LysR substrate-binding domain-containing protein [Xylophilus ampelinus]MCS4510298.1 LysR substrate-binding domain-containing protein [Xylophilus ampelinus]PYE78081.1 LysR family transcriptional regulator [Xylophilus ampelinus]